MSPKESTQSEDVTNILINVSKHLDKRQKIKNQQSYDNLYPETPQKVKANPNSALPCKFNEEEKNTINIATRWDYKKSPQSKLNDILKQNRKKMIENQKKKKKEHQAKR